MPPAAAPHETVINIGMWFRALTIIPRVTAEEWRALDFVSRWLIASRAAVFVMTAYSAAVGGLLAAQDGAFRPWPFVLCLTGLVFAHATNNLLNDITDWVQGVDRGNYFRTQYGPQPLEQGLLTLREALTIAVGTGLIALACAAWFVWVDARVSWLVAWGAFFVLFYTWPLKHIGLGEPVVLVVWGPLMVGGAYLVTTGRWSTDAALVGFVYACGPTAVLFGKHTDKRAFDAAKGIRTLPVILGDLWSRRTTVALMWAQPVLATVLVAAGRLPWPVLAVWAAAPRLRAISQRFAVPRPDERPADFPAYAWPTYFAAFAFLANRTTGALLLGGLVAGLLIR